jgi:hypothetical protein
MNFPIRPDLLGTASGENPAPGTGVRSAFHGSPKTISTLPQNQGKKFFRCPHRKHSLGLGAAALAPLCPSKTGQKEKTIVT